MNSERKKATPAQTPMFYVICEHVCVKFTCGLDINTYRMLACTWCCVIGGQWLFYITSMSLWIDPQPRSRTVFLNLAGRICWMRRCCGQGAWRCMSRLGCRTSRAACRS